MENILSVDRIVGDFAVCEDSNRKMLEIPLRELPSGVREGDVLRRVEGGYCFAPEEKERRQDQNRALFAQLMTRRASREENPSPNQEEDKSPPDDPGDSRQ